MWLLTKFEIGERLAHESDISPEHYTRADTLRLDKRRDDVPRCTSQVPQVMPFTHELPKMRAAKPETTGCLRTWMVVNTNFAKIPSDYRCAQSVAEDMETALLQGIAKLGADGEHPPPASFRGQRAFDQLPRRIVDEPLSFKTKEAMEPYTCPGEAYMLGIRAAHLLKGHTMGANVQSGSKAVPQKELCYHQLLNNNLELPLEAAGSNPPACHADRRPIGSP